MIKYVTGNILDSPAEALVNTVNTIGVMGKGIALQFKKSFPNNYKTYKAACANKEVRVGKMFVTKDNSLHSGEKWIVNFPTKTTWRKPSEYIYIEKGLDDLVEVIHRKKIKSIAIPPLGAGNGGLKWEKVKIILRQKLENLDVDIFIYEPTQQIKEKLKKERVKLTPARALLLFVLYDLVANGEQVSEFSSEKVCYFLQRFGAEKHFKLKFTPYFYGPYSGKIRFLLNVLNGSYILGFSAMDKKPFDPLILIGDGYKAVKNYIENDQELFEIAKKTTDFLAGFYSEFGLELLSSLDYLSQKEKILNEKYLSRKLENWNDRKRSLFSNPRYMAISINHLKNTSFIGPPG